MKEFHGRNFNHYIIECIVEGREGQIKDFKFYLIGNGNTLTIFEQD